MSQSESIANLALALRGVQSNLPTVVKGKTASIPTKGGSSYSYKYADLESVCDALLPILAEHGLSVAQFPDQTVSGLPALTTYLIHDSGEYIAATSPIILAAESAQAQGSGITYLRRYAVVSIVGLVTEEDDDGAQATQASAPQTTRREAPAVVRTVAPSQDPFFDENGQPVEDIGTWGTQTPVMSPVMTIKTDGSSAGYPDDRGRTWAKGPTGPQVKRLNTLFSKASLPGTVQQFASNLLGEEVHSLHSLDWRDAGKVGDELVKIIG